MKIEDLYLFRCPYTNENLEWSLISVIDQSSKSVIFGIVRNKTREYPILDGIMYFKEENLDKIIFLVKKKLYIPAVFLAVTHRAIPMVRKFEKIIVGISHKYLKIKKILKTHSTFTRLLLGLILESNVAKYYLDRSFWKDSLQFFLPLSFNNLKYESGKIYWVDVGSGIHNYYSTAQKIQPITFIVLERDFCNHFFSSIMFPSKNTIRVCLDAQYIECIKRKCHIISFNDSLHYMKNQDDILKSAQNVLRNSGILFASNVMEKKNIDQDTIYPISRKKVSACIRKKVYFFSTQVLSEKIKEGKYSTLNDLFISTIKPIFRYSFLYVKNKPVSAVANIRLYKPAKQIRRQAKYSWDG